MGEPIVDQLRNLSRRSIRLDMLDQALDDERTRTMMQLLRKFIAVERSLQLAAVLGVLLLLGFVGMSSLQGDRSPSTAPELPAQSP